MKSKAVLVQKTAKRNRTAFLVPSVKAFGEAAQRVTLVAPFSAPTAGSILVQPPATVFAITSKLLQPVGVDGVLPALAVAVARTAFIKPNCP